jgi:hypothetical protein
MSIFKKIITSKAFTAVAFTAAAGLLIFSSVGGTQAALTYYSENYTSRFEMYDIGVTLTENGNRISYRDYVPDSDYVWSTHRGMLLEHMIPDGEELKLGKAYPENLAISNSGMNSGKSVDTYSRVIVYKYWLDENGNKVTELDPDLIEVNYVNLGTDWILDTQYSTPERTVLYYNKLLKVGETSPAFADSITINDMLATKVTQTKGTRVENGKTYTTLTTTYDYDGVIFVLEAVVNSIQNHNAEQAAKSVWGRDIAIAADGSLSLK